MEDPIKILDFIFIATPCPDCHHVRKTSFSRALQKQQLDCPQCGFPYGIDLGGEAVSRIEEYFQQIQGQVREKGCWVEVYPFPHPG